MDGKILALLQKNVGNVREKIKHHQEQMQRQEYFLLVAGKCKGCQFLEFSQTMPPNNNKATIECFHSAWHVT